MMAWISANWPWKLLSLCAAFLIWLGVAREPEMATILSVPVLLKTMPPALEISSGNVSTVQVELSGISGRIKSFSAAPSPLMLDLGGVHSPGERTFNVDGRTMRLPRGVQFVRSVPAQLRLVFERQTVKAVPIKVRWADGAPADSKAQVIVDPSSLLVIGPESRVRLVSSVSTDPVSASAVLTGEEQTTSPYIAEPQVRFQNFRHVRVRAILKN